MQSLFRTILDPVLSTFKPRSQFFKRFLKRWLLDATYRGYYTAVQKYEFHIYHEKIKFISPSRPVIFFLLCRQECFSGNFFTHKQECKVCLYIFIPFLFSFYAIYCTYIVACVINLPFLALIFHFSLFCLFVCLFSFLYQ